MSGGPNPPVPVPPVDPPEPDVLPPVPDVPPVAPPLVVVAPFVVVPVPGAPPACAAPPAALDVSAPPEPSPQLPTPEHPQVKSAANSTRLFQVDVNADTSMSVPRSRGARPLDRRSKLLPS